MDGKAKYLVLALLIIFVSLVFWDFLFWTGRFPPNCFIEKIEVSGLSKFEAFNRLKSADVDKAAVSPISIELEGKVHLFRPSEIGAYISPGRTINNSTNSSYRSNYIVDLARRLLGSYKDKVIPLSLEIDRNIFKAVLEGLANNTDVPSKDATFSLLPDGSYKITKERTGKRVSINRSIANLEEALRNNGRSSRAEIEILAPRVFAKALTRHPPKYLLSEYTTYYGSHDSPNRVHNIRVATNRLNNYVMVSGETFSLLQELGDFTVQRGFKEAFVLYNGELEPQYGGGLCQVATTIYNASMLAGLDTIERHNHGIYFTIYPLGRDASIYVGQRDLKIRNNTQHPIYVKGIATEKKVSFRIYGTPTAKRVSFSRPMIFFDGERFKPYNIMTDEAKEKINMALLSGRSFRSYVKVTVEQGGFSWDKTILSHYKLTGDRENVKIVRPEPE